jgi:hypothetical protein
MADTRTGIEALYTARKGVEVIDVPELGFVLVSGRGDPNGPAFGAATQALYTVSYGAHFLLKKERGEAPKVMPLEALWWVDESRDQETVAAAATGRGRVDDVDRSRWCWQAMIMQPEPIDEGVVARAVERARTKDLSALEELRFERWEEGRCAQVLHVGPYAEEGPSLVKLHEGIAAAGYRPRGRHHEIYLGDPRRSAPEKLRTLLRHPVEPL